MTTERPELAPLFEPVQIGRLALRNRIVLPPHGRLTGDLFGSEREAARNVAYWRSRAADGAAWICGLNGFVGNQLIPGFEPTGVGATTRGVFRLPQFRDRAAQYAEAVRAEGAYASAQLIMQGGMPHSPSGVLANDTNNQVSHVLSAAEIRWFVEEYAYSAAEVKAAGLDGIELHANHEDLLQLFLSPATNMRDDEYGGDDERRLRLLLDVLRAIRDEVGADYTVGVRLNMDEFYPGGYELDEGLRIAQALDASGTIDYLHCVVGNNWGAPSYIQPHDWAPAQWAPLAGRFKAALTVPVAYTGRVSSLEVAAEVIRSGAADVVGIARAAFADGSLITNSRAGRAVRPCIGTNDCLHRVIVEGLRFGCSVNPTTGRESDPPPPRATSPRRVLVAGGGPAGMELAALLAEREHDVTLVERGSRLGGQLLVAAYARENAAYLDFVAFQEQRLAAAGVQVRLSHELTIDGVRDHAPDVLAVATGAVPRRPVVDGIDAANVVDGWAALSGTAEVGHRVVVLAMDDHMQPLTIAAHLADNGHDVRVIYPGPAVAPLVGKYSIGAPLARLGAAGAQIIVTERAIRIEANRVTTRQIYSGTLREHTDVDTVVLACGATPVADLYEAALGVVPELHVLGDAYAPRRISFATRQAYEVALRI
ncbi:MAG TPA: FAD-dependent oxidoreductase [Jatrophihabitantaceae bacterium]|nr:FAD-dependent oxidoreductase [Jatrophihabitantaceae bacterium]